MMATCPFCHGSGQVPRGPVCRWCGEHHATAGDAALCDHRDGHPQGRVWRIACAVCCDEEQAALREAQSEADIRAAEARQP